MPFNSSNQIRLLSRDERKQQNIPIQQAIPLDPKPVELPITKPETDRTPIVSGRSEEGLPFSRVATPKETEVIKNKKISKTAKAKEVLEKVAQEVKSVFIPEE